jgi:putative transposase
MARTKQVELKFRTWGGARRGAGRTPRDGRPLVSHEARPRFRASCPVHVTVRMRRGVWNLRTRRCFAALERAFVDGGDRFGLRLIHYSVQGNHIHLLAEAAGKESLSRGMHGLGIRIARGLNRVMRRSGAVLADHYHARILRTPTEVRRVRAYLRDNARKHYGLAGDDAFASSTPLMAPRTWLVRRLE